MKEKKGAGVFYQELVFTKINKEQQEAEFHDKFGMKSTVSTKWKNIFPGIRYNCRLQFREKLTPTHNVYSLLKFWIIEDDIIINYAKMGVEVLLDNKIVPNLTFDPTQNSDESDKVNELRTYFFHKTFQLKTWEDRDTFIKIYIEYCKKATKRYAKHLKNELIPSKTQTIKL